MRSRRPFAFVSRLVNDANVANTFELLEDLPRAVAAGIIDDDDFFWNGQGRDAGDDLPNRLLFVIDGNNDRQLEILRQAERQLRRLVSIFDGQQVGQPLQLVQGRIELRDGVEAGAASLVQRGQGRWSGKVTGGRHERFSWRADDKQVKPARGNSRVVFRR